MNEYLHHKTAAMAGCCMMAASSLLLSPAALALPLTQVLPISFKSVSDQALSKIVGRGVIGGTIVYFGVEMQTNWTSENSQTPMRSTMNVALNSSGNIFLPTITYSVNGNLPQATQSSNNHVDGSGLNNTKGVTQAIQIAGNSNSIQNGMTLNVVKGTPNTPTSGTALTEGVNNINNTTTMTVQNGQLSMAINNGGASVRQGIGPNGLFQIAQVGTNLNIIQNQMKLTLGVNQNKVNTQNIAQLQSILGSMRGLTAAP
ncbi:hypothetical protein [Acidithiobacillus concretivorus]|uniref:Uncharacterized protein n=1 Tax=Acidithiobacillus concretivorus TaxID=3063952 RepID=A0ABS5ZPN4_9PROT|nr:hypothetical protein [Acidithiobacillus concretivorus]MBU2738107.1 hypothetical protein [Acidithiobacillus concretivorus]